MAAVPKPELTSRGRMTVESGCLARHELAYGGFETCTIDDRVIKRNPFMAIAVAALIRHATASFVVPGLLLFSLRCDLHLVLSPCLTSTQPSPLPAVSPMPV